MHKSFGSLTAFLLVGVTLLVACSNYTATPATPATRTPVPRATKTAQSDLPPQTSRGASGAADIPAVRENPEHFGGYNTNLRWLFKTGGQKNRPGLYSRLLDRFWLGPCLQPPSVRRSFLAEKSPAKRFINRMVRSAGEGVDPP